MKLDDRLLPGTRGRRRRWTAADRSLVDEADTILDGTPFSYGHVVVDEVEDHSAVAIRVIGRRARDGSCTLVGDVAQSTAPAGQERWADVFDHLATTRRSAELTIGDLVPEPTLRIANRLLPLTGVDARPSRSVRGEGEPPAWRRAGRGELDTAVADAVRDVEHRHRPTGLVAATERHASLATALAGVGPAAVDHVHGLRPGEVPLFAPEAVEGLEFDGVVVAPHEILDGTSRGARLLDVAITRAVQELVFVTDAAPPALLARG